jgi:hypothetical protein
MSEGKEHVDKLRSMVEITKTEASDVVIADMIAEFGSLVVTLSKALDKTQRRVMWLTVAVVALTAALVTYPFLEHALAK